jgi:hypothetical protein
MTGADQFKVIRLVPKGPLLPAGLVLAGTGKSGIEFPHYTRGSPAVNYAARFSGVMMRLRFIISRFSAAPPSR